MPDDPYPDHLKTSEPVTPKLETSIEDTFPPDHERARRFAEDELCNREEDDEQRNLSRCYLDAAGDAGEATACLERMEEERDELQKSLWETEDQRYAARKEAGQFRGVMFRAVEYIERGDEDVAGSALRRALLTDPTPVQTRIPGDDDE